MTIKEGDIITVDGSEFECLSLHPPDNYCFKEKTPGISHYYMRFMSKQEIQDLEKDNRLVFGKRDVVLQKQAKCYHNWNRYTGLNKVEDYCLMCGVTKPINWRELK